ncbi:LytR C-terminal domain-containing protein [Geodermatophilus ruber]|nr:LytR C-terminal domain-containing protein [Geodermatophilus ruber]
MAPPAAPRTTMAPFQAVPTPGRDSDEPAPGEAAVAGWPADPAGDAPRDAGRDRSPAARATGTASPTGYPAAEPAGTVAAGYRDWTSPSRSRDETPAAPPATQAIPDRATSRRRADAEEREEGPEPTPGPTTGPSTGSSTGVVGGRAAFRAERQAAEAERRRAARRSGATPAAPSDEDGGGRRASGVRRSAAGLLAVAVVALLVLGVYSFAAPDAQEAAQSSATGSTPSTPTASAAPSSALPPLSVAPLPPVEEAPDTPVRVPVTVLNATGVTGLAADIADELGGAGWESPAVGAYNGGDVATTTVYFTDGDETQRQAAVQLIEQFPQVSGPVPRFFEVSDVDAPGLVLVATGEWRP